MCQDELFERRYFKPALDFANNHWFFPPFSLLVIYDSDIHSSSVPTWLRTHFSVLIPDNGENEKEWVISYVKVRRNWLKAAVNPALSRIKAVAVSGWQCFVISVLVIFSCGDSLRCHSKLED